MKFVRRGLPVLLGVVTVLLSLHTGSLEARPIDAISGTWDMVHDDWQGTLYIDPPDQRHTAVGHCTYSYYVLSGTYTDSNGNVHTVSGTLGGLDHYSQTGSACPRSDHMVQLTIRFPGNSQRFVGYLFTHNERTLAGYTWWQGTTFGWYARKR